jgi:uncharacterized protein
MKILRASGIMLSLEENEEQLPEKAAAALAIDPGEIIQLKVIKKATDARRNKPPHFVYVVELIVADDCQPAGARETGIHLQESKGFEQPPAVSRVPVRKSPVVVIGSGPAGLFAASILVRSRIPVLLLERGACIEKRTKDVYSFWHKGILKTSSNVLFGEGGAGTFSDGKLTSRSKNPYTSWIKKVLVEMGAPGQIITDAKPHIGTDKLRQVVINLRNKLTAAGCAIRFEAPVTDFIVQKGCLKAVVVNNEEEIRADQLILAIGQSADDTYRKLLTCGVRMEPKPFAMGLRVEHPQELINFMQYGKWSGHPNLPPAEYFITAAITDLNRSVYTFCMCPGGDVIGSSAFPGRVVTNGMSKSRRDGQFANSAIVVNVRVDDFAVPEEPLSGLEFRSKWENKAFLAGGADYFAPAQMLTDFMKRKGANSIRQTSFLPGVRSSRLDEVLPAFVADSLRTGISEFHRKMPGFISADAQLIGVETRTSSPVRIRRKNDGQSETVSGLYPCGEGSGYAGGIISSALDGIRSAGLLLANLV